MAIELRLPNITGATEREQLAQIKSYLYQFTEQLQWALNNMNTSSGQNYVVNQRVNTSSSMIGTVSEVGKFDAEIAFNSLKPLIIKSAEIVDAYYEEINRKLESLYVAQSDFGDFVEKTSQEIEETSTSTTQRFENIQIIITDLGGNIGSIEGSLGSIEGNIQTIGTDLSYVQKDIIDLSGNLEVLDNSLITIESDVNALDTELQTSKTELTGNIDNAKTMLTGTIASTRAELSETIESTKAELTGGIDSAKAQLSNTIDSTKAELTGDINNAKSELSGSINNAKEELSGSIDNAKEELSGSIDNAKSELTGMVNNVDADLQNTKTDVNGRIDDTNGSVAGLGEGLNDANGRIAEVDQDLQESKETINESLQGVQDRVTGVNALLEDAKAQLNGSLEDIEAYVSNLRETIIGVTAYLKSGLLYSTDAGIPVYGLEIGQSVKDEVAGTEVFNKYARFTSEKLSFYDSNGTEVAYISDKKLFIKMAHITVSFQIGGLISLVMNNGDVVKKWVGG